MSNQETEFLKRWNAEKENYRSWGDFVSHRVKMLIDASIAPRSSDYFVRVPAIPRLKDDDSLLQKAFHRGKSYESPYDDIEDKVGIRFVLLLDTDVRSVGGLIENEVEVWTAVKARDHNDEQETRPYEFNYQSLHYVVRSASEVFWKGSRVPEGLPCEIQIRTLLQHAYSEVTHDTLYKPSIKTTAKMKRSAAKSMALLEATGDYFDRLNELIAEQVLPLQKISQVLSDEYTRLVGTYPSGAKSPLNDLLLDRYGQNLEIEDVLGWFRQHEFLGIRIQEKSKTLASFRVPGILLVYFFVSSMPRSAVRDCPILERDLEFIFSDLGKSLHG